MKRSSLGEASDGGVQWDRHIDSELEWQGASSEESHRLGDFFFFFPDHIIDTCFIG